MSGYRRTAASIIFALLLTGHSMAQEPSQPGVQTGDSAAVERGRTVYTSQGCGSCHGQEAQGGDIAPNLLRSPLLSRDQMGETIGQVVLKGRPNTAMPAFALKSDELADLSQFLHSLQMRDREWAASSSSSIAKGNATRGRMLFERKCGRCHSVTSDLAGIAAKYSEPLSLQQQWLMPQNVSLVATVSSSDGSTLTGHVLRIDEFRALLDFPDGGQRTFDRTGTDARFSIVDPLAEHRSLLSTYSDGDIHDLTSYLLTLKSSAEASAVARKTDASKADTPKPAAPVSDADSGLSSEAIPNPAAADSWPTYSGDYSGKRYSSLDRVNQSNVRALALAWTVRLTAGPNDQGMHPLIVAGEGQGPPSSSASTQVRGSILQVNGVLYLSTPNNAWAIDARTGYVLWHFYWKARDARGFGNRGMGMWRHYLYLPTADDYLVCLDARTGRERWHVPIADLAAGYYSASPAPIIVGHHVLVGSGNSHRAPGFLKSFDPETGELQWVHYSVPMNSGDAGVDSWKDVEAARRGGGNVWIPGSYDPETNLYIYGTGNPKPGWDSRARGGGSALYTCSILAVDVDTGKQAWYYQVSPNDNHDWDNGVTPVLADITVDGKPRKVAMVAARNGYFFVIDRINGEHLLTSKFSTATNWAQPHLNARGQPAGNPSKNGDVPDVLISPANQGAANWLPASFSPDYGLFYVPSAESWSMYYGLHPSPDYPEGSAQEAWIDGTSYLKAIDPKTGQIAWSVRFPSGGWPPSGVLTTAGRLLFSGDMDGNLVARDPGTGRPLWHTQLVAVVSNAPETYLVDRRQYILVAAADTLYAFALPQ